MRILFILEYYHPHIGGVETLFKLLAESIAEHGYQVSIITNRYKKGLKSHEETGNLTIHRYDFKNRYLFTFLSWIPALRIARECDIIHTTSYNAAFPAWVISRLYKKKSIITFHELWGKLWFDLPWIGSINARIHYIMEWLISKLYFDRVVAVSDFTRQSLINSGIPENRVVRIYNGLANIDVQFSKSKTVTDAPFTFTFFGRLGYSKGIDILLDAAISLMKKGEVFLLNLITSPVPRHLLQEVNNKIKNGGLEERVKLYFELGKSELEEIIRESDGVVIPSYSEGFCFAAVETMYLGVPIVSSGRGALKEVIGGRHIHASEFTGEGMSQAMQKAIHGQWEEKPVRMFPIGETIQQYIDLYKELSRSK